MRIGVEEYAKQTIGNGRIFEYIILSIFSHLNMSYINLYRIFIFISAFIISMSIFILLKIFYSSKNTKKLNIFLLLSIFNIFITVSLSEMMIFIEILNMSISILMSIIASILLFKNNSILSLITLILASLNYQATIVIFIPIYLLLVSRNNTINKKHLIKSIAFYYFTLGLGYILLKVIQSLDFTIDNRVGNVNLLLNITSILKNYIKYGFILFVIIFIINIITEPNITSTKNILIIYLSTLITTTSLTFLNSSILSFRMMFSLFGMVGIIGIYLYNNISQIENIKPAIIIQIVFLIINITLFGLYTNLSIKQTNENNNIINEVTNIVNESNSTNQNIDKIAFCYDENVISFNNKLAANYKPHYSPWSRKYFFELILNKGLEETTISKDLYNLFFYNKDWNEFNKEQIQIVGDTILVCIY
mgnify:FL=1